MKILIIRFSSIGDIVLTTPIIRCIKQQLPNVELHFVTKSAFRSVIANNPYIDQCHFFEYHVEDIIPTLKEAKFDLVIDLHKNLRSLKVKKALNLKSLSFQKLNISKWLLVNFKINILPDKSIVDRYFDAIISLGVKNDGKGLDYFIAKQQELENADIPMSHWAGYVACVIGGSYATKQLPASKWIEFCAKSNYPIILLGGAEDRILGDSIAQEFPVRVYNACGKFSLNESAYLISKARVVVSNDTGLMHVAAAYQKPIVSLWGNTSPEMGMYPYFDYNNVQERQSSKVIFLENKDLHCHPCSKMGYAQCPKKHFRCMSALDMHKAKAFVDKNW
jgi:ADP-heptose:LPS heptosyltransferase